MAVTFTGDDIPRARIDLLFDRMGFILFYGAVLYPLFFIVDWHERPWDRPAALVIRVAATLVMLGLVRLGRTAWGRPRALLLASVGFLVAHAGFAVIVWHAKGFGSSNGDAFELFFGPYCVLVPTTTWWAASVGVGMMCIQLAAYALSGAPVHYDDVVWNAIPFFVIFLTGRHVANLVEVAWRRGFVERAILEEANRQLRATRDELVQSEKLAALGRVAAGFAHELKNPLFVIGSSVSTLERVLPPLLGEQGETTELLDTVEGLRAAADDAASVCDLLGQLSSPPRQDLAPADLNTLLDSAIGFLEVKAKLKESLILKNYGTLVPFQCDAKSLIQVFVNLLDNALDAIQSKGNIWISTRMIEKHRILIAIRDDGEGVSPDNLPRLFEPFFSTKRPGSGMGLGLALSRGVVEKHNGSIELSNSKPGAIVTITFPAN